MDVVNILNTIRANASASYQERIPEATRTNLEDIRFAMVDDNNVEVANEFMKTLLNKIVKSVVHTKMFNNPLKSLKKGKKPLGDTIEEIYTNFIKGTTPDKTGETLLARNLPDSKVVYHRMNYQQQYTITVDQRKLSKAFTSYANLETYINDIISKLYSSANLDEFMNMKQLLKSAITNNAMKVVNISDPLTSKTNAEKFIKTVKTVSANMVFPSTEWNGYLTAQSTDTLPITTFSEKKEQILIIDATTDISVGVDVLASAFNMSVVEFNDTRKIIVDEIGEGVNACLVDEAFFQVYDDFFAITSFYNGKGIYTNYYLNVDQTLAYSPLVNAVAFKVSASA